MESKHILPTPPLKMYMDVFSYFYAGLCTRTLSDFGESHTFPWTCFLFLSFLSSFSKHLQIKSIFTSTKKKERARDSAILFNYFMVLELECCQGAWGHPLIWQDRKLMITEGLCFHGYAECPSQWNKATQLNNRNSRNVYLFYYRAVFRV